MASQPIIFFHISTDSTSIIAQKLVFASRTNHFFEWQMVHPFIEVVQHVTSPLAGAWGTYALNKAHHVTAIAAFVRSSGILLRVWFSWFVLLSRADLCVAGKTFRQIGAFI
jgi:hypothetical protein